MMTLRLRSLLFRKKAKFRHFLLIRSRKTVNDFAVAAEPAAETPPPAAGTEIAEDIVETTEVAGSATEISGENAGGGDQ